MAKYQISLDQANIVTIEQEGSSLDISPEVLWAFADGVSADLEAQNAPTSFDVVDVARVSTYDAIPRPE